VRDRADAVRMNPELLDRLSPYRLAGRHDQSGQSQSDEQGCAFANPGSVGVPSRIQESGRQILSGRMPDQGAFESNLGPFVPECHAK